MVKTDPEIAEDSKALDQQSRELHLRDHPLMRDGGVRNWPPLWMLVTEVSVNSLKQQLGVLKYVYSDGEWSNRCYLISEHEGNVYAGYLLCQDRPTCIRIMRILCDHVGLSLKEIGDLDLSYTL